MKFRASAVPRRDRNLFLSSDYNKNASTVIHRYIKCSKMLMKILGTNYFYSFLSLLKLTEHDVWHAFGWTRDRVPRMINFKLLAASHNFSTRIPDIMPWKGHGRFLPCSSQFIVSNRLVLRQRSGVVLVRYTVRISAVLSEFFLVFPSLVMGIPGYEAFCSRPRHTPSKSLRIHYS
jgi:hypothetical protein